MSVAGKIQRTLREIRERKKKRWEPEKGDNVFRSLAWGENEAFYIQVMEHYFPWAGRSGTGFSFVCLGDGCPACKRADKWMDSEDPELQAKGQRIQAKPRFFMPIIDINHPDRGVQLWAHYSDKVISELAGFYTDPEIREFWDPKRGRNIVLTKTKPSEAAPARYDLRPKDRSRLQNMAWLEHVRKLRKRLPVPNPTELKQALGISPGTESDDVEKDHAVEYPCFGISFGKPRLYRMRKYGKKLPECLACPVRKQCKPVWRERKIRIARRKARGGD